LLDPEISEFKKIATASSLISDDDHPLSGFRLSVLRPSNWHLFQIREYPKGVIRCAYEQLPLPWWSPRLFLPLKVHQPQLVGMVGVMATPLLAMPPRVMGT